MAGFLHIDGEDTWNIVYLVAFSNSSKVKVSKNGSSFQSSNVEVPSRERIRGVTKQGWILSDTSIWVNGEWLEMKDVLTNSFDEELSSVDVLEFMDTGLGVALVKKTNGEEKLVLLLPVELAPDVLAVNSDFDEGRVKPLEGTPYFLSLIHI